MFTAILAFVAGNILYFALHLESGSFPKPLTSAQEKRAFEEYKTGDKAARDRLIYHNLRLVAHVVKKYFKSQTEQEDLISIGTIGLIKAVDSFDCDKGARFSTYAAKCIENEVLMHFRSGKKDSTNVSLYESFENTGDNGGGKLKQIDVIADKFDMVGACETREDVARMHKIVAKLDYRERSIMVLRYGLNGSERMTQEQVAKKLKISRSYVSRIEKKTLLELRQEFETK